MKFSRLFLFSVLTLTTSCASGSSSGGEKSGSNNNGNTSNINSQLRVSFCETRDLDARTSNTLATLFSQYSRSIHSRSQSSLAKTITIPVRFHVIRAGDSVDQGSVANEVLVEQISILNRAFSGETGGVATPYRFHLSGIDQILNPTWHVMSPGSASEQDAKRALRVGDGSTLNVYVGDIVAPESGGGKILGYATMPILYKLIPKFEFLLWPI